MAPRILTADWARPGRTGGLGPRLFLGLLCLYLLGAHGFIENADAEVSYQTTRALARRLDPGLSPADGPVVALMLAAKGGKGHGVARGRDGRSYGWFGIGHSLWEAPFYLAGQGLAALFPAIEERFAGQPWALEEFTYGAGIRGSEYFSRLLVSLAHPLAGALSALVLLSLGTLLGLGAATAGRMALLHGLATMAWPFGRESLSDGPGALLLLLALRDAVAWARGAAGGATLARAGLWAGLALSVRVMLGLALLPLGAWVAAWAWKRREPRALAIFGGPLLALGLGLMAYNAWRFGSPFESGYGAQADRAFFSFPPLVGLFLVLFSLGKGLLPCNLPLLGLLALPGSERRPPRPESWLFCALLASLALPCSFAAGWHGGWSWGPRYLLPAIGPLILLTGFAWESIERRPRPVRLLLRGSAALGLLLAAGGVAAPVHGWWAAAFHAAERIHPGKQDPENLVFLLPRYSPLQGQFRYLAANLGGRFEEGGTAGLGEEWFGVPGAEPWPPRSAQLTRFRHLWLVDAGFRFDAIWPIILAPLLLALAAASLLGRGGPIRNRGGPPSRP